MVLVAGEDQVHAVLIKERQPFLADTQLAAIEGDRRRHGDLVHADDDPVDVLAGARRGERLLQEGLLGAAAVATDVRIAAVLITDVIVVEGDHQHRADAERVPESLQLRRRAVARKPEVRLIGLERVGARPPVHLFVLVVAGGRHPRPESCRAAVVVQEAAPHLHAQRLAPPDVRVAEVTVEEIEQGPRRLDLRNDQRGIGRPGLRVVQVVRDALVPEAGEAETGSARRGGLELPAHRIRSIVEDLVRVRRVGAQFIERGVLGEDFSAGQSIDVGAGLGAHGFIHLVYVSTEANSWSGDGTGRHPGDRHLASRFSTELEMQSERWIRGSARLPPERGQQHLGKARPEERAGRACTLDERASSRPPR